MFATGFLLYTTVDTPKWSLNLQSLCSLFIIHSIIGGGVEVFLLGNTRFQAGYAII